MSPLQRRLKSVSRSIYLSFAVLPRSLRDPMGLAYLLCRAADTIADGTVVPVSERKDFLNRYKQLFDAFPFQLEPAIDVANNILNVPFTTVPQDQQLMATLSSCFKWLAQRSSTEQALIGNVVRGVIKGMELDLHTFDEQAPTFVSLRSTQDLENYLLWIGGEPGRFWSEMTLACLPTLPLRDRERWTQNGIVFGTGLQMVNILRDFPADLKRGRCYLPADVLATHHLSLETLSEQEDVFRKLYVDLIEQTRVRLMRGLEYLLEIPGRHWGLRAAVAWPLLIGLKTLTRLQNAPTILNATAPIKIKRWEIYWMMIGTSLLLPSNVLLKKTVLSRL